MSLNKPNISIFGSTGGTGLTVLRLCLRASYQCTVLVRKPEKLLGLLSAPEAPSNLHIIQGDINDIASVKNALLTSDGRLVDIVVSCIGSVPDFSFSNGLNPFAGVDWTICEEGTKKIVNGISELQHEQKEGDMQAARGQGAKKPLLVALSSTGITSAGRDIPLLMVPLYHQLLATPHKDKRAMEDYLRSSAVPSSQRWIIIRPSLLRGDGKGEHTNKKIGVGIERNGKHEKLAIGYTIKREDVGYWIFREIIEGNQEDKTRTAVTLTY